MLFPDHIAAGLLINQSSKKRNSYIFLLVCVFASVLPDLPVVFFGAPGSIDYLAHRKYTNSIILAPLYSIIPLIVVLPFKKYFGKEIINLKQLYAFSLISYYAHIFLDLITPFGTQLFYPVSPRVYSLDLFHSFDPIFLSISITSIILILYYRIRKRTTNKKLIALVIVLYSLLFVGTLFIKNNQEGKYEELIKSKTNLTYKATIPRTFWRWKGIAEDNYNYLVLTRLSNYIVVDEYPKLTNVPSFIAVDEYYKKFIDYARYPVMVNNSGTSSIWNLIYSFDSYRLDYEFDNKGTIINREITSFNLLDPID